MRRVGEDEHGVWLWAPPGIEAQRGDEPPKLTTHAFAKLIPRDGWFSAIWNAAGRYEVYVDIGAPAVWSEDRVEMIDLDLDVVRFREDASVHLLDEDEFLEHQVALSYPACVVDRARATTALLALAVAERREPFGEVGIRWLEAGR
jgi:protein associated with RNAse G/E